MILKKIMGNKNNSRKLEKYRDVLSAIRYINLHKELPWISAIRESFLKDKDLILSYIIRTEWLSPESVLVSSSSEYLHIIVDEIMMLDMWFHFNVRQFNWKCNLRPIDKSHKNDKVILSFQYAIYLIERFKVLKKIY